MPSPIRTARRVLAVVACAVAIAVVGGLFVPDSTSAVLAPLLVVVLGVGGHALSVGGVAELASATLVCAGAAVVVATALGVGSALAGGAQGADVSAAVLGATLPVALLGGYLAARRRTETDRS